MISNLSDLGFIIQTEEEYFKLAEKAYSLGKPMKVSEGTYFCYSQKSGIELWVQMDNANEFMGLNPHYAGKSKRKVNLFEKVDRPDSELDGAYYSWATNSNESKVGEGLYPFIFDLPDFQIYSNIELPKAVEVQLTAFARELACYKSENDFLKSQNNSEIKLSPRSFVPNGSDYETEELNIVEEAFGAFSGYIIEFKKLENELTGNDFYWLLVDTLGGEIDVVADPKFFDKDPMVGGVIHGQFWLSGRIIDP